MSTTSSSAPAAAKPKPKETGRERARRYGQNYSKAAAKRTQVIRQTRTVTTRVGAQVPGTDTFGTVFKMLSIAGLIGLGILHPGAVKGVLDKATSVIKTVITGEVAKP